MIGEDAAIPDATIEAGPQPDDADSAPEAPLDSALADTPADLVEEARADDDDVIGEDIADEDVTAEALDASADADASAALDRVQSQLAITQKEVDAILRQERERVVAPGRAVFRSPSAQAAPACATRTMASEAR